MTYFYDEYDELDEGLGGWNPKKTFKQVTRVVTQPVRRVTKVAEAVVRAPIELAQTAVEIAPAVLMSAVTIAGQMQPMMPPMGISQSQFNPANTIAQQALVNTIGPGQRPYYQGQTAPWQSRMAMQQQWNAMQQMGRPSQWVEGVDNTVILFGGAAAMLLLLRSL